MKRAARGIDSAHRSIDGGEQGWSSHFEFQHGGLRVRTDFSSRPPRIERLDLDALWRASEGSDPAFVDVVTLARMKQTDRERDYAIIGELARLMRDPRQELLFSRSARDLMRLSEAHPDLIRACVGQRPLLARAGEGRERLEEALDAERRVLMRANEDLLEAYERAARTWKSAWLQVQRVVEGLPLREAQARIVESALTRLPFETEAIR